MELTTDQINSTIKNLVKPAQCKVAINFIKSATSTLDHADEIAALTDSDRGKIKQMKDELYEMLRHYYAEHREAKESATAFFWVLGNVDELKIKHVKPDK